MQTAASTPVALPRWETATLFPSLDSREFNDAHEGLTADLQRLRGLYDRHDVREGEPRPYSDELASAVDEVLDETNGLMARIRMVSAYLYAFVSTDARDDAASGRQAQLQQELSEMVRLSKRFDGWMTCLPVDELVARAGTAAERHAFTLRRSAASAAHQMSEAEEGLAADLRLTGSVAWARLHRDVSARLSAPVEGLDATGRPISPSGSGAGERLPMSVIRGLAHDGDASIRERAFVAELDAWESVSVPLAAALNGAIGERVMIGQRRGWTDALDPALFTNNVDRETLDAMHAAVVDSFPDFRRFMHAKARLLGHAEGAGLPWWDMMAPVAARGAEAPTFDWTAATDHVTSAFATFSPTLSSLVTRFNDRQWIDAEPRDGKAGGAFCMPVRDGESRVLLNFDGSFDSVQTLAHELGHAYHNTNLAERTPLQRQTPMALAETASIFCETIVVTSGLAGATDDERLVLLNTDLQGAAQIVVDIHSRFLFEAELCRRRAKRTLSVDELNEMMLDAQRASYGHGLDEATLHPYMWAVKGHYYTPFYNWPYTFGLLFGLGLYARYLDDADSFRSGYDDLLSSTGMGDAAELGARFGIDVRSQDFWAASLSVLSTRIDDFVALVDRELAAG